VLCTAPIQRYAIYLINDIPRSKWLSPLQGSFGIQIHEWRCQSLLILPRWGVWHINTPHYPHSKTPPFSLPRKPSREGIPFFLHPRIRCTNYFLNSNKATFSI
jgi:hypothetical protein